MVCQRAWCQGTDAILAGVKGWVSGLAVDGRRPECEVKSPVICPKAAGERKEVQGVVGALLFFVFKIIGGEVLRAGLTTTPTSSFDLHFLDAEAFKNRYVVATGGDRGSRVGLGSH